MFETFGPRPATRITMLSVARALRATRTPPGNKSFVRRKNLSLLKLFLFWLSNFLTERRFMEAAMTMSELLTLTAVMSIALTIAIWKNNNGGGWF
jgi:hypothetical protein